MKTIPVVEIDNEAIDVTAQTWYNRGRMLLEKGRGTEAVIVNAWLYGMVIGLRAAFGPCSAHKQYVEMLHRELEKAITESMCNADSMHTETKPD